jgi:hypothetical protein
MSNRTYLSLGVSVLAIGLTAALLIHGQQPQKPDSSMTQQQMEEMNKRGDKAMGFDHLKTTHHFLLATNGGSIQVEANDAKDKESRDQIRQHFRHVAMMFSDGNFEVPMLVHAETPPGAGVMQKLKAEISYKYEETERGALIRISTSNADALQGVHDFLRYQIKEHMTGDPLEVVSKTN